MSDRSVTFSTRRAKLSGTNDWTEMYRLGNFLEGIEAYDRQGMVFGCSHKVAFCPYSIVQLSILLQ